MSLALLAFVHNKLGECSGISKNECVYTPFTQPY